MSESRPSALLEASRIIDAFAERTGLFSPQPGARYLWTDAFAVCTLLALARRTGEARYTAMAERLIDRVHHVLGRHRPDDGRTGWLSGLTEEEGEAQPTVGGLRIGKPLPERRAGEPIDEALEWDRDGQYFHYLTKWMHALDQTARATGTVRYHLWARQLAATAYRGFSSLGPDGSPRLSWKMSIDLTRPLVAAMGQHDPLDGYLSCIELRASARRLRAPAGPSLEGETEALGAMADDVVWATTDPLGLGGLLVDAGRAAQLVASGDLQDDGLVASLLAIAARGLRVYPALGELRASVAHRLAFRELGLVIGIAAVPMITRVVREAQPRFPTAAALEPVLEELAAARSLSTSLQALWLDPDRRHSRVYLEHEDINEVMLATSLVPEGVLELVGLIDGSQPWVQA